MNRKKTLGVPLIWALAFLWSVPCSVGDTFEERLSRFQLFSNCSRMRLIIEDLPPDAQKIGLTREGLEATVESRLRSAQLYTSERTNPSFYVNVNVIGNAFHLSLEYRKVVFEPLSGERFLTTTWSMGTTGTHSGQAEFILSSISRRVDRFLLEFLRTNEDACENRFSSPSSQKRE